MWGPCDSLPSKSLAKGASLLGGEPIYLKVDIPQSITEGPKLKVLPPGGPSSSILIASPIRGSVPKAEGEVSMTMEVRELLSQVGLDMSGHVSGNSTPKRLQHMVLITPLPTKLEDFPWPVDTSSQVSTPDDAEMGDASLEEIPVVSSPTAETPGPHGGTSPQYATHLWKEANKTLRELLVTKSSIDTCWQKLVWELGMALCQNNSETAESIKEAKAICTHSMQEAKTLCSTAIMEAKAVCAHSTQEAKTICSTAIREAKAICAYSTQEAETLCSTTIREAEAWGTSQAGSLQQLHAKSIQHLEEQAIKEESKGQLNCLPACQAALWAGPPEFCGVLVASYHVLLGHAPMSHSFSLSQGASPSEQVSAPRATSLLCLSIPLDPSGGIPLQTQQMACPPAESHPRQLLRGPLIWSGKR